MKFIVGTDKERIGYDFYCDIAERIAEGRMIKGWTQEQLAKESGIKLSRLSAMETVKIRITLEDVQVLAKALNVSEDWLIMADLDWHGKECRYLVWHEKVKSVKLYQDATSARMAFLKIDARLKKWVRWLEPRDRAIVQIVGVPLSQDELNAYFPKRGKDEDDQIEQEETT